jgi:limonene-1,2-epoxide hydrolase
MSTRNPGEIVQAFCDAWAKLDLDELLAYFTPDAVYHNIPVDPVVGVDAIRATIQMFTTAVERIEFRVRNLAVVARSVDDNANDGDVVLTERVDVFVLPHTTVELPVMGAFEVRDGRIAAWRDYFDLNQYMQQVAASG